MILTASRKDHAGKGLIGPLNALFASQDRAADIIAPPYDVVTTEEARTLAASSSANFLHVSRAEIDFPPGTDAQTQQVYAKAAQNLTALIESGGLIKAAHPSYFVYRMETAGHIQTGLACGASIAAYEANIIKRHEYTRPSKENDRFAHLGALGVQTGPVLLTHRPEGALAALLEEFVERSAGPDIDAVIEGGARHILWKVSDANSMVRISAAAAGLDTLYIADGHHRSAAAARVAATQGKTDERFLSVLFPSDQLSILPYNRIVRDLGNVDEAGLFSHLAKDYAISPADAPVRPDAPGYIGLCIASGWRRLVPYTLPTGDATVLEQLDVSLLSERILNPLLAIGDPRTDVRLDFVGGKDAPERIAALVAAGEASAGFTLFPTGMDQLMAVSDMDGIMPPKSTWFEPKLADGLIAHRID